MARMLALPSHAGMPALLHLLSAAEEFADICLRRGEKRALNAINKDAGCVRFPVTEEGRPGKARERIKTPADKIFILVRHFEGALAIKSANLHAHELCTSTAEHVRKSLCF